MQNKSKNNMAEQGLGNNNAQKMVGKPITHNRPCDRETKFKVFVFTVDRIGGCRPRRDLARVSFIRIMCPHARSNSSFEVCGVETTSRMPGDKCASFAEDLPIILCARDERSQSRLNGYART